MLGASSLGEDSFIPSLAMALCTQNILPGSPASRIFFMTLPLRVLEPAGPLSRMPW